MSTNTATLQTHQGYTWKDMPGTDADNKRMNFSLFKRGKITVEHVKTKGRSTAKMLGFSGR